MDLPWFCVGDFNEIVKSEEKMGGASRPERQMVAFKEALDFCGFCDLGLWDLLSLGATTNSMG